MPSGRGVWGHRRELLLSLTLSQERQILSLKISFYAWQARLGAMASLGLKYSNTNTSISGNNNGFCI